DGGRGAATTRRRSGRAKTSTEVDAEAGSPNGSSHETQQFFGDGHLHVPEGSQSDRRGEQRAGGVQKPLGSPTPRICGGQEEDEGDRLPRAQHGPSGPGGRLPEEDEPPRRAYGSRNIEGRSRRGDQFHTARELFRHGEHETSDHWSSRVGRQEAAHESIPFRGHGHPPSRSSASGLARGR
ncbi:unnamed protein product, partial [Prorocentrum cordatum]